MFTHLRRHAGTTTEVDHGQGDAAAAAAAAAGDLPIHDTYLTRKAALEDPANRLYMSFNLGRDWGGHPDDFSYEFLAPWRREDFSSLMAQAPSVGNPDLNLWIGQPGVTATAHYDHMLNFFHQVLGHKHFLLASPKHFAGMRPFPLPHRSHRQSQIPIHNSSAAGGASRYLSPASSPSWTGAPVFEETVLGPGDLLVLPGMYWHQVTTLSTSASVNMWSHREQEIVPGQRTGLFPQSSSTGPGGGVGGVDDDAMRESGRALFELNGLLQKPRTEDHLMLKRTFLHLMLQAQAEARGVTVSRLVRGLLLDVKYYTNATLREEWCGEAQQMVEEEDDDEDEDEEVGVGQADEATDEAVAETPPQDGVEVAPGDDTAAEGMETANTGPAGAIMRKQRRARMMRRAFLPQCAHAGQDIPALPVRVLEAMAADVARFQERWRFAERRGLGDVLVSQTVEQIVLALSYPGYDSEDQQDSASQSETCAGCRHVCRWSQRCLGAENEPWLVKWRGELEKRIVLQPQ